MLLPSADVRQLSELVYDNLAIMFFLKQFEHFEVAGELVQIQVGVVGLVVHIVPIGARQIVHH